MMEEGKLAQGGEEESTVLETVIKKTKQNTYKNKQKNPKQQKSTRTVLEHINTLNSDR